MAKKISEKKDTENYIKKNIEDCKNSTINFDASDAEILLVIIDYIMHPDEGVRKTAERTGYSKTWVWKILHNCPAKFDDELARITYMIMHANKKYRKHHAIIGKKIMKNLEDAQTKLLKMKDKNKPISKLNAKFLLWF